MNQPTCPNCDREIGYVCPPHRPAETPTPRTYCFPLSSNSFVQYSELLKSHEKLERELAAANATIAEARAELLEWQTNGADAATQKELATANATIAQLTQERDEARVPLCVGRPIIGHLARDGQWIAEDGRGLVAADELFHKDPYEANDRLRAALVKARKDASDAKGFLQTWFEAKHPHPNYVGQAMTCMGDSLATIDAALAGEKGAQP